MTYTADDLSLAWRHALMMVDENTILAIGEISDGFGIPEDVAADLLEKARSLDTDNLSMERLDWSLCPLHGRDYAICFDDEDPECEAIRECFPGHST